MIRFIHVLRPPSVALFGLLATLLSAAPARAQMTGTCSGSIGTAMLAGSLFLNVDGKRVNTTTGTTAGLFGLSECQCSTTDITLEGVLESILPNTVGSPGVAMYVGVGTDCTEVNSRSTSCREVTKADYPDGAFNLNVGLFQSRNFYLRLPAALLTAPRVGTMPPPFSCDGVAGQTRNLTIFIGDISNNPATCKLSIPVRTTPPPGPTGLSARPGNGAVNLNWTIALPQDGVERYQVLCRDRASPDTPLRPDLMQQQLFYSTCLDPKARNHIRRNNIPGTGPSQPSPDMSVGMGLVSMSLLPPRSSDEGRTPQDVADMGAGTPAFDRLDPRFLCTGEIRTTPAARIDGLENDHEYEFLVLAIDPFGNATPSASLTAGPQRTQNLLEASRAAGSQAGGFGCAMAGGGPAGAAVLAFALLFFLGLRRRALRSR